ncbi:MAG: KamA family radical SAM protein [Desulfuromonadales bacterium]|nr:KamA family radical SAM protein [Desulfuromonadales bacterium]
MTWKIQLSNSLIAPEQLAARFGIDPAPLRTVAARYPLRITPHYLGLIQKPGDPIWRQCVPDPRELEISGLPEDSLNERSFSPVPAVVHRYPDRALLLVSGQCAGYCRFCTRKSRVGTAALAFSAEQVAAGIAYIAATPAIRDVILTGGDPLLLDDDQLEAILEQLYNISHVEMIRIGSRVPVTLPERITPQLCGLLARFQPLYLNTHFNHPRELVAASIGACALLADGGIPLGNQTVLLRGVNDDPGVMLELCRGLLRMRVRPYYLHQLDQAKGTGHFRVPVATGLSIVSSLRGRISGMAIPQYVTDPPDGSGKVPLGDADA